MNKQRSRRAYELRVSTGLTWGVIADKVGFANTSSARRGALKYAKKNKKKPPPNLHLSKGAMAYELHFNEGMTWVEVAEELGTIPEYARRNGQRYAKRNVPEQ
jgi:hypothetical protein